MMMMKFYKRVRLIVSLLLILTSAALFAQTKVGGSIRDENGAPLPGVTIGEKGTSNGTDTDNEGKYALNVSGTGATLVISIIGYKTQEIAVNNQTAINISLAPDITALQEVLVTGYTSERKQDIVSAISTVSKVYTTAIPMGNVEQALQGRVAGVQVTTSGQPGAASQVRIRGFGSFGGNAALYIVYGLPTYYLTNLNPYHIASTTVFKDAVAAFTYG